MRTPLSRRYVPLIKFSLIVAVHIKFMLRLAVNVNDRLRIYNNLEIFNNFLIFFIK